MQVVIKSFSHQVASNWFLKLTGGAPSGRMLRLAALLVACAFAWGGSARSDVASLEILRPLAITALGLALFTIRGAHIRNYRVPLGIALACIALLASQLVPLPPELGSALAGRGLVAEIDRAAQLGEVWRPLTLWAPATQNALWALLVPLSLLVIGVQFAAADLARLLLVILAVGATSAIVALLQTLGDPQGALYLYDITNFGSAVGLFANRNHQAVFLACLIPLIFAAMGVRTSRVGASGMAHNKVDLWLIGAVGAVAFLAALILITGSRSGLLAGVIALFSITVLLPTTQRFTGAGGLLHSRKVQIGLGVALIGALALATVWLQRDLAIDRILDRDQGEDIRSLILPAMRDMIWLYQPWGIGLGAFRDVYEVNEPAKLLIWLYMDQAHNDWLDIALTGGLMAIGIAAVAIGAWLVRARRVFLTEAPDQFDVLRKAGLIVLLILALSSLSDYPTRTPALACLFVLAAIWAALPIERVLKGRPSEADAPQIKILVPKETDTSMTLKSLTYLPLIAGGSLLLSACANITFAGGHPAITVLNTRELPTRIYLVGPLDRLVVDVFNVPNLSLDPEIYPHYLVTVGDDASARLTSNLLTTFSVVSGPLVIAIDRLAR